MTLEGKIANWIELGIMPYSEVMTIQDRLVDLRKRNKIQDTVISVQHPYTVSFGGDMKNNQFSTLLLLAVEEQYGEVNRQNVLDYLRRQGVDFHESSRGGGATVFGPGQYVFYPIVDHTKITGSHQLDVASYKTLIYRTLFESLGSLGVYGLNVGDQKSFQNRAERRDAWLVRDGITHKMGSKGLALNGNVAYHGFSLNVDAEGIAKNWMVNQCGYTPDEVKLWSVEQEIGIRVPSDKVYSSVQGAIARNFGYSGFKETVLPREHLEVPA